MHGDSFRAARGSSREFHVLRGVSRPSRDTFSSWFLIQLQYLEFHDLSKETTSLTSVDKDVDGSDEHEDVKLYCRVTGAEIPHDKYTRRGHFIGCCVGDCMPRDIADVNENNMGELQSQWAPNEGAPHGKWAPNENKCAPNTGCTCANNWSYENDYYDLAPVHGASPVALTTTGKRIGFPFVSNTDSGGDSSTDDNDDSHAGVSDGDTPANLA